MPSEYPRYDEIQQRSIHNAYGEPISRKDEQLLDMLIHHRIRCVELDIHSRVPTHCPYSPEPEWGVYHIAPDIEFNTLCTLGHALTLLRSFHRANPRHEVVTVHLELKSRSTGGGTTFFPGLGPDQLDDKIRSALGAGAVFTPADLLALNPGARDLLHAVDPRQAGRGWPTVDRLRGKFIFVVQAETWLGHNEVDDYAPPAVAGRRVCFVSGESKLGNGDADAAFAAAGHIVFHELGNDRARALRESFPGVIIRSGKATDADGFFAAQAAGCNLIATDKVDHHDVPWARTHNQHRYPFGRRGEQGAAAWTHPSVADLVEPLPLVVLSTRSGDIAGTADSFTFATTDDHRPARPFAADALTTDEWIAVVASTSNDTVHGWGKCLLMARDGLDRSAPYFAVGRAADDHGVTVQWRSQRGGGTSHMELGNFAYTIGGHPSSLHRENVHWIRLQIIEDASRRKRFVASCSATGGRTWTVVKSVVMNGGFEERGLAASAHGSHYRDVPHVDYSIQHLVRNGHRPRAFEVTNLGDGVTGRLDVYGVMPRNRGVTIEVAHRHDEARVLRTEQREARAGICDPGGRTWEWSEREVTHTRVFAAEPHDYDAPVIEWLVGGVAVTGTMGALSVPVDGRTVTLDYSAFQSTRTLSLANRPADGAYSVEVQARVSEADGRLTTASPRLPFTADPRVASFEPAYYQFVRGCLRDSLDRLRVNPTRFLPRDPRDPVRLDSKRFTRFVDEVATVQPGVAARLRAAAAELATGDREA